MGVRIPHQYANKNLIVGSNPTTRKIWEVAEWIKATDCREVQET